MLAVIEFCFSSFWVYCGCTIWICIVASTIMVAASEFRPMKQ
jgi:hypothetical protein